MHTGKKGRPRFQAWPPLLFAQVIKQYSKSRVGEVLRRIVQGTLEEIEQAIQRSQGKGVINTSFIERFNATFRSSLAALVRKGRVLARTTDTLHYGMYVVGTIYNFCTCHDSLRIPGLIGGHKWLTRTPAMAASITDHQWSVHELLTFKVSPPPSGRLLSDEAGFLTRSSSSLKGGVSVFTIKCGTTVGQG